MSDPIIDAKPDESVKAELRNTIDELIDEHGLGVVFWSLDAVYDEYDEECQRVWRQ